MSTKFKGVSDSMDWLAEWWSWTGASQAQPKTLYKQMGSSDPKVKSSVSRGLVCTTCTGGRWWGTVKGERQHSNSVCNRCWNDRGYYVFERTTKEGLVVADKDLANTAYEARKVAELCYGQLVIRELYPEGGIPYERDFAQVHLRNNPDIKTEFWIKFLDKTRRDQKLELRETSPKAHQPEPDLGLLQYGNPQRYPARPSWDDDVEEEDRP
jgi:hypothetical protein